MPATCLEKALYVLIDEKRSLLVKKVMGVALICLAALVTCLTAGIGYLFVRHVLQVKADVEKRYAERSPQGSRVTMGTPHSAFEDRRRSQQETGTPSRKKGAAGTPNSPFKKPDLPVPDLKLPPSYTQQSKERLRTPTAADTLRGEHDVAAALAGLRVDQALVRMQSAPR